MPVTVAPNCCCECLAQTLNVGHSVDEAMFPKTAETVHKISAALSGSHHKAPGSAGGYLLWYDVPNGANLRLFDIFASVRDFLELAPWLVK